MLSLLVIVIGLSMGLFGYDNSFAAPLVSLPLFILKYQGNVAPAFTVCIAVMPLLYANRVLTQLVPGEEPRPLGSSASRGCGDGNIHCCTCDGKAREEKDFSDRLFLLLLARLVSAALRPKSRGSGRWPFLEL